MQTARAIFDRYEEIRPRLPRVRVARRGADIGALSDIAGEVDAFVFDAYGVLNVGETPIPGARERLEELRARGCHIRILTNAASYDRAGAVAKFARLGMPVGEGEIVTSRAAALRHADPRHWGAICAAGDRLADVPGRITRLGDAQRDYDAVEGVLFLSTADWSAARQDLLERSLAAAPRPVLIANADLVAPRGGGFSLEPGYYGHRILDRIETPVRFFGKPFAEVYEMAERTLPGIAPGRIAMCGDTLHTDILGAAARGWRTVLVTRDGLFAGEDTARFSQRAGLHPDWRLARI